MQIVIDIKEDMIKSLEQGNFGAKYNIYDLVGTLMNGTPLPEGAEILTKEAYSDLCSRAADVPGTNVGELISRQPEKRTEERTETRACVCIDKQSAIDAIGNVPDHDDGMVCEALSHAQRNVALLPPVTSQSERKPGKWLSTIHHCRRWIVCSQCGEERMYDRFTVWNYCPNCGSTMEGGITCNAED